MTVDKTEVDEGTVDEAVPSKASLGNRIASTAFNPALHAALIVGFCYLAFMWGIGLHLIYEVFVAGWNLINW